MNITNLVAKANQVLERIVESEKGGEIIGADKTITELIDEIWQEIRMPLAPSENTTERAYCMLLVSLYELLYKDKPFDAFYRTVLEIERDFFLDKTNESFVIDIFKGIEKAGYTFIATTDCHKLDNEGNPYYLKGDTVTRPEACDLIDAIVEYVEQEMNFNFKTFLQLLTWCIIERYSIRNYEVNNGVSEFDKVIKKFKSQKAYFIKALLHLYNGEFLLSNLAFKFSDAEVHSFYERGEICYPIINIEEFKITEAISSLRKKLDNYFLDSKLFSQIGKINGLPNINNSIYPSADDDLLEEIFDKEKIADYWRPKHINSSFGREMRLYMVMKKNPEKICTAIEKGENFMVDPMLFLFAPKFDKRILTAYGMNLNKPAGKCGRDYNEQMQAEDAHNDWMIQEMIKDGLNEIHESDPDWFNLREND